MEQNNKSVRSMVVMIGGNNNPNQSNLTIPTGDQDESFVDAMDTQAEMLIIQLNSGVYSIGMLSTVQKQILYRFFAKYNPILSRSLSLFTKIITSTITVQKPKDTENDIVQDYVHSFFSKFIKHTELNMKMKAILTDFWIYKKAYIMVESDYISESDTDVDLSEDILLGYIVDNEPDVASKVEAILEKYKVDPKSTTKEERDFVIDSELIKINPKFKGPKRLRVINPLDIEEVKSNEDIGVKYFKVRKSEHVTSYIGNTYSTSEAKDQKYQDLIDMGYTNGYLNKYKASDDDYIELSNDILDEDGCYMIEFSSESNGVDLDSILIDLLTYHNLLLKQKERTLSMNKGIKILSAPTASQEDFDMLTAQINQYSQNTSGIPLICANYELVIEDVTFDQRVQFEDDSEEVVTKRIITGLGIPDSLISGQDTYGGSFLKLETMETEFATIRDDLTYMVEENIFLPVSIQKGFITSDLWGSLVSIKPELDFKVGSIINKTDFKETLSSLVGDGKLPDEYLVDYLGYDNDEVKRKLKEEAEEKASASDGENSY